MNFVSSFYKKPYPGKKLIGSLDSPEKVSALILFSLSGSEGSSFFVVFKVYPLVMGSFVTNFQGVRRFC